MAIESSAGRIEIKRPNSASVFLSPARTALVTNNEFIWLWLSTPPTLSCAVAPLNAATAPSSSRPASTLFSTQKLLVDTRSVLRTGHLSYGATSRILLGFQLVSGRFRGFASKQFRETAERAGRAKVEGDSATIQKHRPKPMLSQW